MSSVDDHFPAQAISVVTPEAERSAAPTPRTQKGNRSLAAELIQTILLTLVIFLGVRSVVQNFRVEGASMEPNLETGEYLLINKASYFHIENTPFDHLLPHHSQGSIDYLLDGPKRGDVVVFRAPPQPDKDFIKRLIGMPGDSLLIRNGKVYINGQLLDEPYIEHQATYNYPADGQPLKVPEDSYFVLGDNRPNSSDSHLGWFVPVGNFVGKAWVSYWPPSDWGVLVPSTSSAH